MDTAQRVAILKNYETECYSLCMYILRCESMALQASKEVLYYLFKCQTFFTQTDDDRNYSLRKESTRIALNIYKQSLN
ncbi:hypothetical protein GC093_14545 [Paenibacillus sp. LMG 31456]|uniref:Uncharacterized protein n=1 Tax=Paenibacillus foliorum TaxID=2654974 RepID=A0A972GUG4_9BACL|nr:hypothetical protein [Paenibacillus foliorum]NOU94428.1 hypothetical protein [Paenibacillus foliorum]